MNTRQSCVFSFEDALKMQPKSRLEKIIDTLDLSPVLAHEWVYSTSYFLLSYF